MKPYKYVQRKVQLTKKVSHIENIVNTIKHLKIN